APGASDELPTAPNDADNEQSVALNAVVLPPLQPRAYPHDDTVKLTFEGPFTGERSAGFLQPATDGVGGVLEDATTPFCGLGVYDVAAMTDYAQNELGLVDGETNSVGIEEDPAAF